jgi:endoglucanase
VGIGNKGTAADYQGDDPVYPGDHGAIAAIAEWMDVPQTKRVVDGVALPGSVRPSYWVDDSTGGPDTGASVAAALAATSIVFRQAGDTAYADELLSVAKAADAFANRLPQGSTRTRRLTEGRIVDLPSYPSRSAASARFRIWSAAWLYRADEAAGASDTSSVHLDRARAIYDSADAKDLGNPWDVFSVGSPANGAYTMFAAVTGTQPWVDRARAYCDFWLYRRSNQTGMSTDITTTPGGFVCRGNGASWNIHFLMDASPPMLEWADSPHNTDAERKAHLEALFTGTFSKEGIDYPLCPVPQLDYILGDNPLGMSYLQGYAKPGASWVDNLHYRSTWGMYGGFGTPEADRPGRNIFPTYGLLAPGPDHTDFYPRSTDLPTSIIGHQEPIIYSGGILTALARKIRLEGANAGEALGVFPEWITPAANERTSRYFVQAIRRSDSAPPVDQGIRVLTTLENRNFIEPQQRNQLGFRVYFTLDNGAQLDDIKIVGFWADTHGEWSGPFAAGGNLAYFTIRFPNDYIGPGEWRNHSRKAEFTIQARQPGLWDSSNDTSFAGLAT